MASERFKQIRELFEAARELSVEARGPFLDAATGGDSELRAEIERLLAADQNATEFLKPALVGPFQDDIQRQSYGPGTRVGSYEVVQTLGVGGMGAVYLAHRADKAFDKQVALKLVRAGPDSGQMLDRFSQERRILAG